MAADHQTRANRMYELWLNADEVDPDTKRELQGIAGNAAEIEDRFYKDLEFGTGGLRGVMGAGTNRMNVYTVGRAAQGLAQYVLQHAGDAARLDHSAQSAPSVAIAYDSRHLSPEFALEAALVMAGNGIKAWLFKSLRPTPELSFAVRELGASAGIVITASHNPPEYNGFKAYGADGGQLVPDAANQVLAQIQGLQSFDKVVKISREIAERHGYLEWLDRDFDSRYVAAVTANLRNRERIRQAANDFRIVYTPLHGAGNLLVRDALRDAGFTQVHVVAEQELPDGMFPTVKSPNPEEREAFDMAIELAEQVQADIIVGTDPDSDRMGAVVRDARGQFVTLTGNQAGTLMIHYLLASLKEQGALPDNGAIVKTIVTGEMGAAIAASYGIATLQTLTGFKYIGEKMTQFAASGEYRFLFGYEESYGYLAGDYCRDKDAVLASVMICEAAAYYKTQGKTLFDVLQELYRTYGYFAEVQESRTYKGKDGVERIQAIMDEWRHKRPASVAGMTVEEIEDYSQGLKGLPPENVLKYKLAGGAWFCLRPSGTEPKIKVYFAVKGSSEAEAKESLAELIKDVMEQ